MKLIIDIPKSEYMEIKRYYDNLPMYSTVEAERYYIAHGIPLDDVKETIEQDMSFDMFDDYGNKTRIHKELWEILDNIGKESEGTNDKT